MMDDEERFLETIITPLKKVAGLRDEDKWQQEKHSDFENAIIEDLDKEAGLRESLRNAVAGMGMAAGVAGGAHAVAPALSHAPITQAVSHAAHSVSAPVSEAVRGVSRHSELKNVARPALRPTVGLPVRTSR